MPYYSSKTVIWLLKFHAVASDPRLFLVLLAFHRISLHLQGDPGDKGRSTHVTLCYISLRYIRTSFDVTHVPVTEASRLGFVFACVCVSPPHLLVLSHSSNFFFFLLLSVSSHAFLPVIWHARLTALYLGLVDSVFVSGDARRRKERKQRKTEG